MALDLKRLAFIGLVAIVLPPSSLEAQSSTKTWKETVLHSFSGVGEGDSPECVLVFDSSGSLYGTTAYGGNNIGTVFKLTPPAPGGTEWTSTLLYSFKGGSDGAAPYAGLIFDGQGALYGTTVFGGIYDYGTIFKLTPPSAGETQWTETVLYSFTGGPDGGNPAYFGSLIFDSSGALYGTTQNGGNYGYGTVFKLTPGSGTQWTETVLYSFTAGSDGRNPQSGVIFDSSGALYGTTLSAVFKLTPPATGGTPWVETTLANMGGGLFSSLIFDSNGALYGTQRGGNVYKLTPPASGQTQWTLTALYSFPVGDAFASACLTFPAGRRELTD
jgi:uncharacterized repeat protein (TIGR03803 family)